MLLKNHDQFPNFKKGLFGCGLWIQPYIDHFIPTAVVLDPTYRDYKWYYTERHKFSGRSISLF